MDCSRHKVKRVYSHGYKAKPRWICKECGAILSRNKIKKDRTRRKR